ncbi:MAG: FABP family protein [Actinomycetota bacterium]
MSEPDLHPALAALQPLLGTWRGEGAGEYPTIESFVYVEEISIAPGPGKPFLVYGQRTRHRDDGRPLHAETGYWRAVGDDRIEVVLSHPTGIVERLDGSWDGRVAELVDDDVASTPTAVTVTRTARRFELDGDTLRYTVAMAAVGHELTHHLRAELHRAP